MIVLTGVPPAYCGAVGKAQPVSGTYTLLAQLLLFQQPPPWVQPERSPVSKPPFTNAAEKAGPETITEMAKANEDFFIMMFSRRLSEVGMATRRARTFSERHNHTSCLPMSSCCFRKQISIAHARSEYVFFFFCFFFFFFCLWCFVVVCFCCFVKKIDAAGLQTRLLFFCVFW